MGFSKINSFPHIGPEYFFPFFLEGIGYNKCEDPMIMRPEGYHSHLIVYSPEGTGELIINGETYILHPNSSFVICKNYPHQYRPLDENWNTHWITFDGYASHQLLEAMHIHNYGVYHNLDIELLHKYFHTIFLYSTEDNEYGNFKISAKLYEFLIEYNRQINFSNIPKEFPCKDEIVLNSKRFMEQYYFKDLTLDSIASQAFVSKQHLCRLFQKNMNMSPMQYLLQIRIQQSKKLLIHSAKSVQDIASEVGFNSPYYFTSTFKKAEGITPTQYRRTHTGNAI